MGWRDINSTTAWRASLLILVLAVVSGGTYWYFFSDAPLSTASLSMVSGTEYISGEEGQIIVRLATDDGPITDAACNATLLYPDKSYVFIDKKMEETSVRGNYYVGFTTPSTEGVYEERIRCTVGSGEEQETLTTSDSFHVSPGLNLVREVSKSQRRQFKNLSQSLDSTEEELRARINTVAGRVSELENKTRNMTRKMEEELNESIADRFAELSNSFADTASAMQNAFQTSE